MTTTKIMSPDHPEWKRFMDLLYGPEGCNFRQGVDGETTWNCDGLTLTYTGAILKKYFPDVDIAETVKYFEEHGGYCDCEVIWNVDR